MPVGNYFHFGKCSSSVQRIGVFRGNMTGVMHLTLCVLRIWKCPNSVQNGCIKKATGSISRHAPLQI
nr:MAG TPA: hypothetical protein [Caudoviricetes sp.]